MKTESRMQNMPLNPDMLLAILDILDISDVLAMRQVGPDLLPGL